MARIPWNKGISTKSLGKSRRQTKLEKRSCLECGADIFTYPSTNKRFCNLSCRSKTTAREYPLKGEKSPGWKGGVSTANELARAEFKRSVVPVVLARDNYRCTVCDEGGYLHVDHIKKWSDFPELRLNPDNCRSLCVPCHYYVTFKKKMPKSSTWGLRNRGAKA